MKKIIRLKHPKIRIAHNEKALLCADDYFVDSLNFLIGFNFKYYNQQSISGYFEISDKYNILNQPIKVYPEYPEEKILLGVFLKKVFKEETSLDRVVLIIDIIDSLHWIYNIDHQAEIINWQGSSVIQKKCKDICNEKEGTVIYSDKVNNLLQIPYDDLIVIT